MRFSNTPDINYKAGTTGYKFYIDIRNYPAIVQLLLDQMTAIYFDRLIKDGYYYEMLFFDVKQAERCFKEVKEQYARIKHIEKLEIEK